MDGSLDHRTSAEIYSERLRMRASFMFNVEIKRWQLRKEEEEARKEKEKEEEEKKEKAKEKAKIEKDEMKQKRKRKRELKKAGDKADSSAMEVDHDTAKDNSTSKSEPALKKARAPTPALSVIKAKAPAATAAAEFPRGDAQASQTQSSSHPPTPAAPIPSHFPILPPNSQIFKPQPPNANQCQYQTNIRSSFTFSNALSLPQPSHLPPGGQALGLGTLGGESPWLVPDQAQLGIEMMRRQEAVNAAVKLLRSELANVRAQLLEASSQAPGSEDISALVTLEQNLKNKLIEITYS